MAHPPPYGQGPHNQPPYGQGPQPPYGPGPQQPPPPYGADPYQQPNQRGYRRRDGAGTLANVIHLIVGIIVSIFLLHILFVVFEANQDNGFVDGIYNIAKVFVLGLGDVFTPDDAKVGVVLNYGFAALIYLIISQLIVRALNRP
jgi:branched-subunit amino acid transport protein AzlD